MVSPRQRILLVCYGNLCRSPMAEALLRARLPSYFEVGSAGTAAVPGQLPTPEARKAVEQLEGIQMLNQRSRPVTVELLRQSDHLLTMSRRQAAEVVALVPEIAPRTRLLGAFAPAADEFGLPADPFESKPAAEDEVGDPMGSDFAVYAACCRRIVRAVDRLAEWLRDGADPDAAPRAVAMDPASVGRA